MSSSAESKAPSRLAIVAIVGLALVATAFLGHRLLQSAPTRAEPAAAALDEYGVVPEFSFVDHKNAPFSRERLLGKVNVLNFIFTRCPTICPVFTMKMKRVDERLPTEIQLVSFSVDPEYDTPEILAEYAAEQKAESDRWFFVTGDAEEVKKTVEGALKISMVKQGMDLDGTPDIVHGTHFVLLDPAGKIRGYYNADDASRIDELVRDAKTLLGESK